MGIPDRGTLINGYRGKNTHTHTHTHTHTPTEQRAGRWIE